MRLSVITDEVSQDPAEAIDFLRAHGVDNIALRSAWGVNLALLPQERLEELEQLIRDSGMTVSAIMSPLFKCHRASTAPAPRPAPQDPHVIGVPPHPAMHLELAPHLLGLSARFQAAFVRIFSFLDDAVGPTALSAGDWSTIKSATTSWPTGMAAVENEHVCSIRTLEQLQDLTETRRVPVVIDPANHCRVSGSPVDLALTRTLIDAAVDVHVKDIRDGAYVPLGRGDLPWAGVFERLHSAQYAGFVTLECHLRGDRDGVSRSITVAQQLIEAFRRTHHQSEENRRDRYLSTR